MINGTRRDIGLGSATLVIVYSAITAVGFTAADERILKKISNDARITHDFPAARVRALGGCAAPVG